MNNEGACFALANKEQSEFHNNKVAKAYNEVGYKNLKVPGKRTANISLNISNSSQTSTAKDLKTFKQNLINSEMFSPNKKINYSENNKKNLCDYQKEKRSPPEIDNVVIIVGDNKQGKSTKNDNLLSKYLKNDTKSASKSAVLKETNAKNSSKKSKPSEYLSPDEKNTFTVDSEIKTRKETKVDTVEL